MCFTLMTVISFLSQKGKKLNPQFRMDEDDDYQDTRRSRRRRPSPLYEDDNDAERRISSLENQVDKLKAVVRKLADALQEELLSYENRLVIIEGKTEELSKLFTTQTRAIRKQEDRLKKGLSVVADALNALNSTDYS